MPSTMVEKIIAKHSEEPLVSPGEYVMIKPDYSVSSEPKWQVIENMIKDVGAKGFVHPERVVLVIDHSCEVTTHGPIYEYHNLMRSTAKAQGVEHFYDIGRVGLRHQVMVEEGLARPGGLFFSDEGNLANAGAVGALNFAITYEVYVTMIREKNWLRVPESMRIKAVGKWRRGVTARDLGQRICADLGPVGGAEKAHQYEGDAVYSLSMDERMNLLSLHYHTGSDTAVMKPDALALDYVRSRTREPFEVVESDPGAHYSDVLEYNVSQLEPEVAPPPSPSNSKPISDSLGVEINEACIASCGGGRLDDLRAGARILKGRKVHPGVRMFITPISQEIYKAAVDEGLLGIFSEAGAMVLPPSCSTCWGYLGRMQAGEVMIATHQENYQGRNGSREAQVYLANPYVVAASAVAGKIADPRPLLEAN